MLQPPPVYTTLPRTTPPPPEDKLKKYALIIGGVVVAAAALMALVGQGVSFFLLSSISGPTATTTATTTRPVGIDVPPDPPTITPPSASAVGQSAVFDIVAQDANNDDVAYGIDWNGNDTVDLWLPAGTTESGPRAYLASGTHARAAYSWATAGTYKVKVMAQDSTGLQSPWTTVTVTVSAPVATTLAATPSTIDSGQSATLAWSATGASSCVLLGVSAEATTTSGSVRVAPAVSQNYQMYCDGPGGRAYSQVVPVQVIVPTISLRALSPQVTKGSSTTLLVSAANVDSCVLVKNDVLLQNLPATIARTVSYSVSDIVTGDSLYILTCNNGTPKPLTATQTVTVE